MQGGAANEGGGGHRNSDGPADVAQHVEEAGGVAHLFARDGGGGHGGQRHKDKAQRKAGEHDGNQQRVGADVEVDRAEDERADAEADESGAEQLAIVDAGAEDADDRRADERADAARADDEAGGEGGVAEDLLVVERQDGDGDVDAHAQQRDQKTAGAEVAVLEDVQVDQAARIGPRAPDPADEARR